MGNRKKDKKTKRSKDVEDETFDSAEDGRAAHQRPNCCDTLMLALVGFFSILAIGAAVPLILGANGTIDIDYIKKKIRTPGPA